MLAFHVQDAGQKIFLLPVRQLRRFNAWLVQQLVYQGAGVAPQLKSWLGTGQAYQQSGVTADHLVGLLGGKL